MSIRRLDPHSIRLSRLDETRRFCRELFCEDPNGVTLEIDFPASELAQAAR
jgi:hypothetical protein